MKDEEEDNIEETNDELDEATQEETFEEGFEDIVSTGGNHFYENDENPEDTITKVTGMYKDWF